MYDRLEREAPALEIRDLRDAEIGEVDGGGWILIVAAVVVVGGLLAVGYCAEHNRDNAAENKQ